MNDEEIGRLFGDGAPPRGPRYWENIEAALLDVDAQRADGDASPAGPSRVGEENRDTDGEPVRPITMQILSDRRTDNAAHHPPERPARRARVLAMAAAVVALVGIGAVLASRLGQSETTGIATEGTEDSPVDGTGPDEGGDGTPTTSASTPAPTSSGGDDAGPTSVVDTSSVADAQPDATDVTTSTQTTDSTDTTDASNSTDTSDSTDSTTTDDLINEAESGLQYDYGQIVRFEEVNGETWIWFDRWSFGEDKTQGVDLTFEPRYEMATDWHGGGNENNRLRTFRLSSNHTVLELNSDRIEDGCGSISAPVGYVESRLTTLLATDQSGNGSLVSLTFDDNLQVTQIRDQRMC